MNLKVTESLANVAFINTKEFLNSKISDSLNRLDSKRSSLPSRKKKKIMKINQFLIDLF